MSLYHEAAKVLDSTQSERTSIKTLIYSKKDWKSDPKTLFALSTEAAKWSEVLSEVLGRSGVLKIEKQLTPTLALVLAHDLFLSKRGIALPAKHGLHTAILKHKARLSAELTKARLRRGFVNLDSLRATINSQGIAPASGIDGMVDSSATQRHPRWVRINTLRTTLGEQLASTFADYEQVASLQEVTKPAVPNSKVLHVDEHVPNLVAIPSASDIATTQAYRTGQLILQDKASCFPAYLLNLTTEDGVVIDACAAPGNKTTHLAAFMHELGSQGSSEGGKVIACEKDVLRSQTLETMVKLAGANDIVQVKSKQDFTKLNPDAREFANVTSLLLDPSCSGSGIVGRDEGGIMVHLPSTTPEVPAARSKKRKRPRSETATTTAPQQPTGTPSSALEEELPSTLPDDSEEKLKARLVNLSAFQLRLLEHAMRFPAAKRITYSTCSVHAEENENVVMHALLSVIAKERGWQILKRDKQVDGMRKWNRRGVPEACQQVLDESRGDATSLDADKVAEACIRCHKGSEEGTMGFFVVCFVRNDVGEAVNNTLTSTNSHGGRRNGAEENVSKDEGEEWNGFEDEN